jgi:hypothetical protein
LGIVLTIISIYLLDGLKLKVMTQSLGYKISFFNSVYICVSGMFLSFITPFSIGGQPYQIYYMNKNNINSEDATNIIFTRTVISLFMTFIIEIIGIIYIVYNNIDLVFEGNLIFFGIVFSFFNFFFFLIALFKNNWIKYLFLFLKKIKIGGKKTDKYLENYNEWSLKLNKSIKLLFREGIYIVLFDLFITLIILILQAYVLYIPFNYYNDFQHNFFVFLFLFFIFNSIIFLVPTPGSSGGFEGIFYLGFKNFVKTTQNLFSSIIFYRIFWYYSIIIIGVTSMIVFKIYNLIKKEGEVK